MRSVPLEQQKYHNVKVKLIVSIGKTILKSRSYSIARVIRRQISSIGGRFQPVKYKTSLLNVKWLPKYVKVAENLNFIKMCNVYFCNVYFFKEFLLFKENIKFIYFIYLIYTIPTSRTSSDKDLQRHTTLHTFVLTLNLV